MKYELSNKYFDNKTINVITKFFFYYKRLDIYGEIFLCIIINLTIRGYLLLLYNKIQKYKNIIVHSSLNTLYTRKTILPSNKWIIISVCQLLPSLLSSGIFICKPVLSTWNSFRKNKILFPIKNQCQQVPYLNHRISTAFYKINKSLFVPRSLYLSNKRQHQVSSSVWIDSEVEAVFFNDNTDSIIQYSIIQYSILSCRFYNQY